MFFIKEMVKRFFDLAHMQHKSVCNVHKKEKSHSTLLKVQKLKGLLFIVAAKCGFILPH